MEVNADPKWISSLTDPALNSIAVNNRRITSGSDEVLVNPAYEGDSDDSLKQSVEEILSSVYVTPGLRKVEDANAAKFGPRSIAVGWEDRKSSLYDYFGKEDDSRELRPNSRGHLRAASAESVSKSLIKSSSSGLPYMRRKGLVLDDAITNWQNQEGEYPCVLYTRTQEDKKTRNVWGYPISDTIAEQKLFIPWLEVEKNFQYRAALSGYKQISFPMFMCYRAAQEENES